MALYADVVGPSWDAMPPAVRRIHDVGRARGTFDVQRGAGALVRGVAWLFRLPPPGRSLPVELEVTDDAGAQRWRRSFGGVPLVSRQYREGAVLVERLGPVECELAVAAADGVLEMRSTGARLRLGPLRCPLPRRLGPRVHATVEGDGGGARVHVEIHLGPLLLMRYAGRAEAAP